MFKSVRRGYESTFWYIKVVNIFGGSCASYHFRGASGPEWEEMAPHYGSHASEYVWVVPLVVRHISSHWANWMQFTQERAGLYQKHMTLGGTGTLQGPEIARLLAPGAVPVVLRAGTGNGTGNIYYMINIGDDTIKVLCSSQCLVTIYRAFVFFKNESAAPRV